jgi:hypothetical protein
MPIPKDIISNFCVNVKKLHSLLSALLIKLKIITVDGAPIKTEGCRYTDI